MSPVQNASLDHLIRKLDGATPLSEADKKAIRNLPVTIKTIEPGQALLHEGNLFPYCCLILEGWTYCQQVLSNGRRQILSLHIPGDLPDLQSLHLPDPDFGMQALTTATVAFVPHAELRALVAASSRVSTALWRETLITAAIHRAWITSLGRRDARARLAHLFCELYLRLSAAGLEDGGTIPMPLRQHDLADAIGVTSVHINRMIQDLRGENLVHLRSRRLEIRDWPGLRAAADFKPEYLHLPSDSASE
jgi:CRP-like cAMP-binding protein